MKKSCLLLSAAVFAMATAAQPAFAQATADEPCVDANNDGVCDSEEPAAAPSQASGAGIVITGSRIARPTLNSSVPMTSVTAAELTNTGDVSLGDALNELPSLRNTFSQGNSTRFIGTAGLNILDLRGLGTARTLVLVNGRRHVSVFPGSAQVDVNTIPVDLLERVDIVTGGNSAIYGSDAVAGVVNFITRRDYDGIALRAQGGASTHGDRGNYFISGTFGKNFADGRGNVAVSAEYARSNPLFFRDRDSLTGAFSGRCQFNLNEPSRGEPFGTDGIPDNEFFCGVNNAAISDGGTLGAIDPASNPTRRFLRFDSQGNVFIDTPTRAFSPVGSGNQIGGQGSTLRNTGQLAAGLDRYSVNLLSRFDVSDAFQPFLEAKYSRTDALQEGQPSFQVGSIAGFFGGSAELRCDNPFLSAQAFSQMSAFGICNATPDASPFTLARFNTDFGGRGEKQKRETYRVVGGVEGTFNEDWKYEVALNYGRFESSLRSLNNLVLFDINGNEDGFLLALDATRNMAGDIVCRVNAVTVTRPDCVPINIFGVGAPSLKALNFVNTTATRQEHAEQIVASASVAGDLSQLFELPGGPIALAFGGEYRTETASSIWDPLTASGGTFLNAIAPFTPPKLKVKDAFAEVNIPLLANMPFAEELSVNASTRVSDYNTTAGTVWAYNVQGLYAPIPDIRFRAAYAESVRAPTQDDLFSPQSQNFAFITDPCDQNNIGNNPNRVANCAAGGVPVTHNAASVAACAATPFAANVGDPWRNCTALTFSTSFLQGGNPTLQVEKGQSVTLGAIFQPRFIPGLNFTADYYDIKVTSLIATLPAQTILNLCFDDASGINNPFCGTVSRDPATGLFGEFAVVAGGVNFARQETRGIDFDIAYRRTFDNGHRLSIRAIATHTLDLNNFTNPQNPIDPNRQRSELGDPTWAGNLSVNYDFGSLDLNWNMRYIGRQTIGAFEAQNQHRDVCPASGVVGFSGGTCTPGEIALLDPLNADQFPRIWFPDAFYHNFRATVAVNTKFSFYAGVDNAFNRKPPFGLLGTAGGDPFDSFGRFLYAGIRGNF